jgi:hypothetical protein
MSGSIAWPACPVYGCLCRVWVCLTPPPPMLARGRYHSSMSRCIVCSSFRAVGCVFPLVEGPQSDVAGAVRRPPSAAFGLLCQSLGARGIAARVRVRLRGCCACARGVTNPVFEVTFVIDGEVMVMVMDGCLDGAIARFSRVCFRVQVGLRCSDICATIVPVTTRYGCSFVLSIRAREKPSMCAHGARLVS